MIYLDNSATTRVCGEAVARMERCMREEYFNPSALYGPSIAVREEMNAVRAKIASLVRCPGGKTVFVSGGTEADNLAILGLTSAFRDGRILFSAGEHPAVKEACRAVRGLRAEEIPYDARGRVNLERLEGILGEDVRMICVMQVNNETGAIQPLREIGEMKEKRCPEAFFHVDGVQGFLRVPADMTAWRADSYALSSHKIHGPKGCGALVISPRARLSPRMLGGGQEGQLRSGTENTPGILGMGAAIDAWPGETDLRKTKEALYLGLRDAVEGLKVNGPDPLGADSAPHILNVSLEPVRSETMLHALEGQGILIGIGSACASNKQRISEGLKAMGIPRSRAESALRFSLSPLNTAGEMKETCLRVKEQYDFLSPYRRR